MRQRYKLSLSDVTFYSLSYIFLIVCGIIIILPLLNVLAMSLSAPESVLSGRVFLLPRNFTLETYRLVINMPAIRIGYLNTFFYMTVGTLINLVVTMCCAYPLSRRELVGRRFFTLFFTFTMLFSGGMIPTFLVIRNLGLLDTRMVMLLPNAMTVWNMILCRTFLWNTIPHELYESAELDGASDLRVLTSIVLPLSVPIIAVMALFYAVGTHWNSFFDAMLYLRSPSLFNIQLVLRNAIANIASIAGQDANLAELTRNLALAEATKYTIIMLSMIPVLIIYPFAQRYFIKGIMIGSLKG